MSDRVSSGSRRLNAMLGGGLPGNGINLIIGLPGSGRDDPRPAVRVPQRDAGAPGDLPLHGLRAAREDPAIRADAELLRSEGGRHCGVLRGSGWHSERRGASGRAREDRHVPQGTTPGMIVIDSFKALHPYAQRDEDFRRFLHELAGRLSAFPVTSFWVGEYGHEEMPAQPSSRSPIRSCRSPSNGKGSARYGSSRCSSCVGATSCRASTLTGSPATGSSSSLDWPILPIRRRTSWTTSGSPRASRSWTRCSGEGIGPGPRPSWRVRRIRQDADGLALHLRGARNGEPGAIATLQENAGQLGRIVNGFGWSLDEEGVELMYRAPVDLYLDEWVHELLETVEATGARRIVIDGLGDLKVASTDETRFREYVYSLLQRCSRQDRRDDDTRGGRALRRHAPVRIRDSHLRQRRAPAVPSGGLSDQTRDHRDEDESERSRPPDPRVRDHRGRVRGGGSPTPTRSRAGVVKSLWASVG